jgi:Ni,Fe-hydrogenase maturation factor
VIFVDASVSCEEPCSLTALEPAADSSFSTHSVSPRAVLHLARECFGSTARGYLLEIRGYEFDDFGERLSARARANLDAALEFAGGLLRSGSWDPAAGCLRAPAAFKTRA